MDKRKVFNLGYEMDFFSMSLDMAYTLSDEMDHAAEFFGKELAAGNEIDVNELVRKLKFFSNVLHLQLHNLSEHSKNVNEAVKALKD